MTRSLGRGTFAVTNLLKCLILAAVPVGAAWAGALPPLAWETTTNDTALALINQTNGQPVWRVVCDPSQPKPYVYPLATLEGAGLTANSPADHPWHHSLWFSWKYINGINYWEAEGTATNQNLGRTLIQSTSFRRGQDFSARVQMTIAYAPQGQPAVLREVRTLNFSAPRPDGSYCVDWDQAFTVGDQAITLDRTPPTGTSGGYAGLSLRFPKGTTGWNFLTSEGAQSAQAGNGKPARWVDFFGPTKSGPVAGIAVFDHPANPRHPTAWYLNASHPYFSPALIYHEPLKLAPGATLRLQYRVLVHEGPGEKGRLQTEFEQFAAKP
jgi:hypothetical protein